MSRRRSRSRSAARSQGGRYAPPARRLDEPYRPARRVLAPVLYLADTRTRASSSVSGLSTVRAPLMRTVLRDTTSRNFNRRRSPDVPARALARMKSLMAYQADLAKSWPAFSESSLQRAQICARRSIRREVLLALGRGNGRGSRGRPKSKEKC